MATEYLFSPSTTINFIMLDSAQIVMQYGSGTGIGAKGVGGATAAGRVTRWELHANDRKQTIDIRISAHTPIGSYDIYLYADGYPAVPRPESPD
jgi:hypothetical protein